MTEPVALLDLQAQYRPLREQFLDVIARVCDSQRCIMGEEVLALERELADYLGVKHAIGVSSGTDALLVALMAARHRRRRRGDHPALLVLRDRRLRRPARRAAGVRRHRPAGPTTSTSTRCGGAITPKTKAIMPVHLFGQAADMTALAAAAGEACRSSRTRRRPSAPATASGAGRRPRAWPAASRSFRPRTSAPSATAAWSRPTTTPWPQRLRLLRDHGSQPQYYHAVDRRQLPPRRHPGARCCA